MTSSEDAIDRLRSAVKGWPNERTQLEAERIVRLLCSHPSVCAVVVFGSSVRSHVRSFDLDLLFIHDGPRPRAAVAGLEVDLRGYEQRKVPDLILSGHDLLCWALKFGVEVCERDGYWTRLSDRFLPHLPWPSATEAIGRSHKALRLFADLLSVGDIEAALEQYVTLLTHEARAILIGVGVYPASRPELPDQLRRQGRLALAGELDHALRRRRLLADGQDHRVEQFLRGAHRQRTREKSA